MLNEKMIKGLEGKGFVRWTRGDMDRLYINPETALDFEYDTNKSGHVSGAYLNGERISNSRGAALVSSKTYIDIATGKLVSNHDMMRQAAQEIMDTVAAEIEQAEAVETAEDAETAETGETAAMKWDNEQINRLEDAGFRLDEATGRMWLSYRALELDPIWYSMEFRGVTYTQADVMALIAAAKGTYIDAYTGELHSDNAVIREAAEELMAQAMR